MFGHIATQVASKRAQLWADRIDLDGLVHFLHAQHPEKTAANISARTGYPIATTRKWLNREVVPNGIAITALYLEYGPELLYAAVRGAPEWLCASVRARRMKALDAEIAERQAARSEIAGGA